MQRSRQQKSKRRLTDSLSTNVLPLVPNTPHMFVRMFHSQLFHFFGIPGWNEKRRGSRQLRVLNAGVRLSLVPLIRRERAPDQARIVAYSRAPSDLRRHLSDTDGGAGNEDRSGKWSQHQGENKRKSPRRPTDGLSDG